MFVYAYAFNAKAVLYLRINGYMGILLINDTLKTVKVTVPKFVAPFDEYKLRFSGNLICVFQRYETV